MIEEYKVGEYGLENETEGMYARTDNGIIGNILNSNSDEMINGPEILVNEKIYCIERDSIKDIKEDIIDLIEVGDFVNGYKVLEIEDSIYKNSKRILIYKNDKEKYERWIYIQEYDGKIHTQDDIEEILTKEQYQANRYTVERKKE